MPMPLHSTHLPLWERGRGEGVPLRVGHGGYHRIYSTDCLIARSEALGYNIVAAHHRYLIPVPSAAT